MVSPGQPLTFVNDDAAQNVFHTITACRAPCTATTGHRLPAGQRRRWSSTPASSASGRAGFTPAANRKQWQTPPTLTDGTYTYFCRIHPFMRGAFRVKG